MTGEGDRAEAKKSAKASSVYFITTVYHRKVRQLTHEGWEYIPDYEEFKDYINEQVAEFYERDFVDCLKTMHPELAGRDPPTFKFDIALEVNVKGWLHHHCTVEATYDRIVDETDPKGRLMRWMIDYSEFNRVFREVLFPGKEVPVKVQIENIKTNSLENLKNYILKKQ